VVVITVRNDAKRRVNKMIEGIGVSFMLYCLVYQAYHYTVGPKFNNRNQDRSDVLIPCRHC